MIASRGQFLVRHRSYHAALHRVALNQTRIPIRSRKLDLRPRLKCWHLRVASDEEAEVLKQQSTSLVEANGSMVESMNSGAPAKIAQSSTHGVELDDVLQQELRENGFRSTRRTRVICTIGPASSSEKMLETLAQKGMNVARLNMCHATQEWHRETIKKIRDLNKRKGYSIAIMLDTEGSEVHTSEFDKPLKAEVGDMLTFTVRKPPYPDGYFGVSYDAFIYDIKVGDQIIVDGGMVRFDVIDKAGPDVHCRCIDPGLLLSRANLTFRSKDGSLVRGQNANLSVISAKDWHDIDFAIEERVDFIAVSFVKTACVIENLKEYIQRQIGNSTIEIIAKIESVDSLTNLEDIARVSDGLMVARGDLGAQVDLEDVPSLQKQIVVRGRELGIPVIVASHLLQSMLENPIPTRAEAADVADVVRQQADGLMLCSESAVGLYCDKAVDVLTSISTKIEEWCRQEKFGVIQLPEIGMTKEGRISEEICAGAVMMANQLSARAIFAFTRRGYMAQFLSRLRPDCPIFAFTDNQAIRRRLNLRWGVCPFLMEFDPSPEKNVQRTFKFLKYRTLVAPNDLVIVVSDIRATDIIRSHVRSVQIRSVPE
eukprot:g5416.t1